MHTIELISKEHQLTSKWQGGTTTQLFIYPKHAEYATRNFLFRISTATVEVAQSTFTTLTHIKRILMILDGTLTITHQDQYSKTLNPFDTDTFDGGWKTTADGCVTDFNLMMAEGIEGSLNHQYLLAESTETIKTKSSFTGLYLKSGDALMNGTTHILEKDFILFQGSQSIEILALQNCDLIIVTVDT